MAGRKVRDEREARQLLAGQRASGLDLPRWAQAHGVDGRSLNAWRMNLAGRAPIDPQGPRVVELVAREMPTARSGDSLVVRCGAFTLEVPRDFDEDHVGRLLTLLAAC